MQGLSIAKRYALFEKVTLEDRSNYFELSTRPMQKANEDDMELLSDIVTWGELFSCHFEEGIYHCARCHLELYASIDKIKWARGKGGCIWGSFRKGIDSNLSTTIVHGYNGYKCTVTEVFCANCDLFVGHAFEDGLEKGDIHPNAGWRH